MTLTIVSRSAAGLPPVPSSIGHRSLSSWTGIKVHHTGGTFSSWKAVHDWQTEGRPDDQELAYVGYSFGVADGQVTELRGWDHHPAHDHENSTLAVVFGGNYTSRLPAPEDLAAFVEFARLARERTGKRLPITGHRDTWPAGDWRYSSCPGDRLYAHLPELRARVEEDDMPIDRNDVDRVWNMDGVVKAPAGYTSDNDFWSASNVIRSAQQYARAGHGLAGQVLREQRAGFAALSEAVAGRDITPAVRATIREEFATLGPALAEELRDLGVTPEKMAAALRVVLGSVDEQA